VESKWKNYHIGTFLGSLFPKTEIYARFFLWRQNNLEVNYSPFRISGGGGVFLGEIYAADDTARRITKKRKRKITATRLESWNVRTLDRGGKLENLKKEMQLNEVSVLGVSDVRWKGHGEIRSGDDTVYYSGGERAEKGVGNSSA
jgi:hypothetical protein